MPLLTKRRELGFTILGGIRLDGLDRMRVTLKVEVLNRKFNHYLDHPDIAGLAIRQNLDLYNHHQEEKLSRLIADRLEVGSSPVVQALGEITDQLEGYRLQQIEARKQEQVKPLKVLTEAEQGQKDNKPFSGIAVIKFDNGKVSNSIHFKNGIPDGKWTAYGYQGEIVQEGKYTPIPIDNSNELFENIKRISVLFF
ncbi:hypothetical protein QFZ48_004463 [Chitinophaga sp. W2I13]|uniref:hypothetical protein n=1 Tax=Chitinophaga sp. W2I13 TaxID=3373923 RepID=UPI003D227A11